MTFTHNGHLNREIFQFSGYFDTFLKKTKLILVLVEIMDRLKEVGKPHARI